MFSSKKNSPKPLIQLDHLYKKIISKFDDSNRIDYCESLIYRTQKDLSDTRCRMKRRKLKRLLKAAKLEIKKLSVILMYIYN